MFKKTLLPLNNYKNIPILLLILVSILFFLTIIYNPPKNFGDGSEYTLMLESLYNHQSPELRSYDIQSTYKNALRYDYNSEPFKTENAYSGYFLGNDNNYYSYHFFGYSLLNLPVRSILGILDLNPFYAFSLTNLIFFILGSFTILKLLDRNLGKNGVKNTIVSLILLIGNSSLLYLTLNHTEYFSFILVLLSSLLFFKNRYLLSILLASLASIQNTPILFLVILINIYVFIKYFREYRLTKVFVKRILLNGIVSLIGITPFIFYYISFSTFNLIQKVGGSDFSLITLKKLVEMFIDPNLGILFFSPLSILGLILGIYLLIKKDLKVLTLLISLFLMCLLSTATTNWNAGMVTSTRYSIWSILPIGSVLLIEFLNSFNNSKRKILIKLLVSLLFIYQIVIVLIAGGIVWNAKFGASGLTPFSQLILNNVPSLYSPTQQIFEGRVLCNEKQCDYPIIYKYNNECKKVLLENNSNNISKVINDCGDDYNIDYCSDTFCYYSY